ncbi:hypothetical protein SCHPADRAFT_894424 [Schizopora paradoxa]|uniref:Retrotransposon gag domain-containing protein n=1 Tax=Schizopora paradoxa TaxID=27342 RepID=A0A0H2RDX5_9AGAM|nr:hypothetical protein SCHPADRAFT_894424 [Schizopora paradoxa]
MIGMMWGTLTAIQIRDTSTLPVPAIGANADPANEREPSVPPENNGVEPALLGSLSPLTPVPSIPDLPALPLDDDNNGLFTIVMASLCPAFNGPIDALNITAWLSDCEDAFENFEVLKDRKLDGKFRIREAGRNLQHEETKAWWMGVRTEQLAKGVWKDFVKLFKERFLPANWRLLAFKNFHLCYQRNRDFCEYASELSSIRNSLESGAISGFHYRLHLLFHSNEMLYLRVLALNNLDIQDISSDTFTALLQQQWDSLTAEGRTRVPRASPALTSGSGSSSFSSTPLPDRNAVIQAGGCTRCRLTPQSVGWYPHAPATCRGDPSRNIPPSRELQATGVKKEPIASVVPSGVLTDEPLSPEDLEDSIVYGPSESFNHVAALLPGTGHRLTYEDLEWSESGSE